MTALHHRNLIQLCLQELDHPAQVCVGSIISVKQHSPRHKINVSVDEFRPLIAYTVRDQYHRICHRLVRQRANKGVQQTLKSLPLLVPQCALVCGAFCWFCIFGILGMPQGPPSLNTPPNRKVGRSEVPDYGRNKPCIEVRARTTETAT